MTDVLQGLHRLVGEWTTEMTHPAFPSLVVHGRTTFEWLTPDSFLIVRSTTDHPEFPDSVSVIGDTDGLQMHYFDALQGRVRRDRRHDHRSVEALPGRPDLGRRLADHVPSNDRRKDTAMRQLTVNTFMTLDGVMQAPGGPEEDRAGGFTHGGWSVNYWDDRMGELMGAFMGEPFDLVLGRKTYEIFAAHWPDAPEDEAAKALNDATKHVASRTLTSLEWQNSVLIEGDLVGAVRELKRGDGPDLQVHGSANLLQTLIPAGVVDRYQIWTFPVVVGRGKRLFAGGTVPAGLKLVDLETSSTGVVFATYEPAGELVTGSFALEEPTEAELERRRKIDT